ncbi:hypothetical protein QVG61_13500 [Thiohalobacter sp. IOR34]|uniref:hypothetical protein n=1 Tax=Thiohalobacter sp. IOR34 TaxID=3057176 RepID=UPI0025AF7357|nr:hypothetical protein [Thiohalobacter sp. IOR34]WJW75486.1 hypothetical protein QVG61_13500 [Thiohalobacter sp. IOR34]
MRWSHFIFLQLLLLALVAGVFHIHGGRVILLKKPPPSLARWYKPANKRQVWLHNMFKLRREMQALRFYAGRDDGTHLRKWSERFSEHYRKIAEMVPEWNGKLDMRAVSDLQQAVQGNQPEGVKRALDQIAKSCDACHADYRAVTAAIYRAADFSTLRVGGTVGFEAHMEQLSSQVNLIKIAAEDGAVDLALSALVDLERGMAALGQTCVRCHEKDPRPYPDDAARRTLERLKTALRTGTARDQGRELGSLAVQACARCHGTHRLAYDAARLFVERRRWLDLIRH